MPITAALLLVGGARGVGRAGLALPTSPAAVALEASRNGSCRMLWALFDGARGGAAWSRSALRPALAAYSLDSASRPINEAPFPDAAGDGAGGFFCASRRRCAALALRAVAATDLAFQPLRARSARAAARSCSALRAWRTSRAARAARRAARTSACGCSMSTRSIAGRWRARGDGPASVLLRFTAAWQGMSERWRNAPGACIGRWARSCDRPYAAACGRALRSSRPSAVVLVR